MWHKAAHVPVLAGTLIGLALTAGACSSSNNNSGSTNTLQQAANTVQSAVGGASSAVKTAVAGLVQQTGQLVAPVQGTNTTQVKQQALDTCHSLRDQLKSGSATVASQVDRLCTQIQNTDPNDKAAWNAVEQQLQALKALIGA